MRAWFCNVFFYGAAFVLPVELVVADWRGIVACSAVMSVALLARP